MAQHIHIADDLAAYAITAWAAHIAAEQESVLVELLKNRERPDNNAFARSFGAPDADLGTELWADPDICEPCGKGEEVPECCGE